MWEMLLNSGGLGNNDKLNDAWRKIGNLSEAVNGGSLAVINKKLYLYGGQTSSFVPHGKLWEIDITTGAVVAKAAGGPRRYHKAFAYNGKMYVHGGYGSAYSNDIAVYDPVANSWNNPSVTGITPPACDRYSLAFMNNLAYIIGGQNGSPIAQCRVFNPATNVWANFSQTSGIVLPGDYVGSADGVLNKIYIDPGFNGPSVWTCYDTVAGSNVAKASPPSSRNQHVASAARNGIYFFGGTAGTAADALKTLRYDIASNVWGFLKAMPFTLGNMGCIANDGSKIYMCGGNSNALDVYEYTP